MIFWSGVHHIKIKSVSILDFSDALGEENHFPAAEDSVHQLKCQSHYDVASGECLVAYSGIPVWKVIPIETFYQNFKSTLKHQAALAHVEKTWTGVPEFKHILLMDKILHHQGWWLSHYL